MSKDDKDENKRLSSISAGGSYIGLSFHLIVPILLGVWGGFKLDEGSDGIPKWTLILTLVGIIVGFYSFIKEVKKLDKQNDDK